jgi:hypothetical protein
MTKNMEKWHKAGTKTHTENQLFKNRDVYNYSEL